MLSCALIDLHTSRLLLLLTSYFAIASSISVLIYITVSYVLSILLNVACDVHEFGIDVRVFAFISTGFWMCQLYYNINRTKLWDVPVCNIKVIDSNEEVISIVVGITVFLCTLNVLCPVNKSGNDVGSLAIVTTLLLITLLVWCVALLWIIRVWFVVSINVVGDDAEEGMAIDVPTGGAPPPEITSTSTTADGTCNEQESIW